MKTNENRPVRVCVVGNNFKLRQTMARLILDQVPSGTVEIISNIFEADKIVVNFMKDVAYPVSLNNSFGDAQHQILYIGESKASLPPGVTRLPLSGGRIRNIGSAVLQEAAA